MSDTAIAFQLVPTAFAVGMAVYHHLFGLRWGEEEDEWPLLVKLLLGGLCGHCLGVYLAFWYEIVAGLITNA